MIICVKALLVDINNWDLIDFFNGRSWTTRPVFLNVLEDERNDRMFDKRVERFVDKSELGWLFDEDSQSDTPESPPPDDEVISWRLRYGEDFSNRYEGELIFTDNDSFFFVVGVGIGINGDFLWEYLFDSKS